MILTPKNKATVTLLWLIVIFLQPLVYFGLSYPTLKKFGFPLNAETLVLFAQNYFPTWLLQSAVDFFLLWLALHNYPGQVNIFWQSQTRPKWNLCWSVIFGAIIIIKIVVFLLNISLVHLLYVPVLFLSIYVLACIRCGIINSKLFAKTNVASANMT